MPAGPSNTGFVTLEEYFRLEALSEQKHDYRYGRMIPVGSDPFADAPTTDSAENLAEHKATIVNVSAILNVRLKGARCRVHGSDIRVKTPNGSRFNPDVTVICGLQPAAPLDSTGHTFANPTVIVEVLSPSTAAFDRTRKFD